MMTTTMIGEQTMSIRIDGTTVARATYSLEHERAIYTCLRTYENRDFRDLAAVEAWVADCNAEIA